MKWCPVLHSYKLTRFSNKRDDFGRKYLFYTLTNLQGSQTIQRTVSDVTSFTLLQTYKVLKRKRWLYLGQNSFTLLQTYKVLKLLLLIPFHCLCFTLLQTYKVLKLFPRLATHFLSFTLLQTYKVLKQSGLIIFTLNVLHSYKLTRFSNWQI